MDTLSAFAMGAASRGKEMKVFDWVKAATLIMERKPERASAGLAQDMEWTEGPIWRDGAPVPETDACTYLASTWATPVLVMDGDEIDCFKMESEVPGHSADTYWPAEALAIVSL